MENVTDIFPDISFIDDTTVDEVLTQMINDYQTKYKEITSKEVSLAQADPYRLIMYACTMQIYQAMQYADYAGKMSFLKYAREDYLDNLAALRGVKRTDATPATTELEFSLDAAIASAVSIPAGTRVTNGNDIYFATDKYAEIKAGETSVTVPATCTVPGLCGNNFDIGELNVVVNTLPYIVAVSNTVRTFGGADIESDEALKNRIYTIPNSYSTAGPSGAYEFFTKSVDPTISDVIVKSNTAGEVDIYFVCEGGVVPDSFMIQKVEDYLTDRSIRPLTDHITVQAPDTESYDVEFTYYIPSSKKAAVSTIQTDVATAVSIYNAWQTERIGRDINPSYLIQKVMEAGAKRVEVTKPAFQVLNENTIAQQGTVTVTYGGWKMIKLYDSNITDILPEALSSGPNIEALGYAISQAMKRLITYCQNTSVYAVIDSAPDRILDMLALELNTQYYRDDLDIEAKRNLIKNTLVWYMSSGTPAAVEELVAAVFGEGEVQEWFEYGDEPYYFRIVTNAIVTPEMNEQFSTMIERVKNTRSHIRSIEIHRTINQNIAASVASYQHYKPAPIIDGFNIAGETVQGKIFASVSATATQKPVAIRGSVYNINDDVYCGEIYSGDKGDM